MKHISAIHISAAMAAFFALLISGCAVNIYNTHNTRDGSSGSQHAKSSSREKSLDRDRGKTSDKSRATEKKTRRKSTDKRKTEKVTRTKTNDGKADVSTADKYKEGRLKLKKRKKIKGKTVVRGKDKRDRTGNQNTREKTKDTGRRERVKKGQQRDRGKSTRTREESTDENENNDGKCDDEHETTEFQSPPDTPSENEFGYEQPVYGCFEGEIFAIETNSKKLPDNLDAYPVSSVLYACEWNIKKRSFTNGFPGVSNRIEWFAIRYRGTFGVSETGAYKFRVNSDDGTKLYIDGKLVIDNDGIHKPVSKSVTVQLTAGDHDMVLEYFQGPRYFIALQVFVTPPGGKEKIFSVR